MCTPAKKRLLANSVNILNYLGLWRSITQNLKSELAQARKNLQYLKIFMVILISAIFQAD